MRSLVVALTALAALTATGPTSGGEAACAPNLANRLRTVGPADQLITVEAPRYKTTSAALRLWARGSDGCWRPVARKRLMSRTGSSHSPLRPPMTSPR